MALLDEMLEALKLSVEIIDQEAHKSDLKSTGPRQKSRQEWPHARQWFVSSPSLALMLVAVDLRFGSMWAIDRE